MFTPPEKQNNNVNSPGPMDYNVDMNNIDELLSELSTPVQDFSPPEPSPNDTQTKTDTIYDPVFGADDDYSQPVILSPEEKEKKLRNGERIARIVDKAIGFGAATLAKSDDTKPYQAEKGDIDDLAEAWAEYTADKDFDLPPWLNLLVLYIVVYMPKITKAFNDRRINELSERITRLEEKENEK